jgi:hypothetical protein
VWEREHEVEEEAVNVDVGARLLQGRRKEHLKDEVKSHGKYYNGTQALV